MNNLKKNITYLSSIRISFEIKMYKNSIQTLKALCNHINVEKEKCCKIKLPIIDKHNQIRNKSYQKNIANNYN